MARRFGFKPSAKEMMRQSLSAQRFYAMGAPDEKREQADAELARMAEGVDIDAVHRKRAAPRQLEAPVVAAISELLATHPRVIWAARFNSGMASYEAKSGRYAPVWFHKFLRSPEKMRMPDFFGLTGDQIWDRFKPYPFKWFAIEAKAPGWKKPRDDREREQAAFLRMIEGCGGVALFATSADDVAEALK